MGKDILVPLQQEEQEDSKMRTPQLENYVVVEKDIDKLCRKLHQMNEQGWYPRNGEYILILNRRNVDADHETTGGASKVV